MLNFTNCSPAIQHEFVAEFVNLMRRLDIKSVPANCYDKDLSQKIQDLCQETATGFLFDEYDQIGVEPYGYVSDFFEAVLRLIRQLKDNHIEVGISGYFMMLDLGVYECVLRQRVEAKEYENGCMCYDQAQCICCQKWVDLKDAHTLLFEEEAFWMDDELNTVLYPSGYANGDDGATFCICSEECQKQIEN